MKQTPLSNKLSTTINPNNSKPPGSCVISVQPNNVKLNYAKCVQTDN